MKYILIAVITVLIGSGCSKQPTINLEEATCNIALKKNKAVIEQPQQPNGNEYKDGVKDSMILINRRIQ